MIIFFRGKAATGKSYLAEQIQNKFNFEIISKDSVFDLLLNEGYTWSEANDIAYNKLSEIIQIKHNRNENIIVDIGLAHNEYFRQFLSKMKLEAKNVFKFLFVCSSEKLWNERIVQRILNPNAPNQMFKSVEHAKEHYGKYNTHPLENEMIIDSCKLIDDLVDEVAKILNLK